MSKSNLARCLAMSVGLWAAAHGGPIARGANWAQCTSGQCVSDRECTCIPNAETFGYFHAQWRTWPGEARPDVTFPQSIGRELLPNPQGSLLSQPPILEPAGPQIKPRHQDGALPGIDEGPSPFMPDEGLRIPGEEPPVPGIGTPGSPLETPIPGEMEPGETPPWLPRGTAPDDTLPKGPAETPAEKPQRLPFEPGPGTGLPSPPDSGPGLPAPPGGAAPGELPGPPRGEPSDLLPGPPGPGGENPLPAPPDEPLGSAFPEMPPDTGPPPSSHPAAPPVGDPPPWFPSVGRPINPDPLAVQPRNDSMPPADDGWRQADPGPYQPPYHPATPMVPPVAEHSPYATDQAETYSPQPLDPMPPAMVPNPAVTYNPHVVEQVPQEAGPNPAVAYDPRLAEPIPAVGRVQTEPQQAKFETPAERWDTLTPEALEGRSALAPTAEQPRGTQATALDGFCPVTLVERENWQEGDPRWGAVHDGKTYLFSGPDEQQRFLQNPERYAPVLSGIDPVLALDEQQTVAGNLDFSVVFDGRLYMFSSRASLAQFRANPQRYSSVEEVP